jgi:DNA-binding response OmpR family regulator
VKVRLTKNEQIILEHLAMTNGHVSTTKLIEAVWSYGTKPPTAEGAIRVHIHHLRRKLAPMGLSISAALRGHYRLEGA